MFTEFARGNTSCYSWFYFFKMFLHNSPCLGQKNNTSKYKLAGNGKLTHLGSREENCPFHVYS